MAGHLVVPVVREPTKLDIQDVWPIVVGEVRIEDDELLPDSRASVAVPEAALVAARKQPPERIVADVPTSAAFVHGVYHEIGGRQLVEGKPTSFRHRVLRRGRSWTRIARRVRALDHD